MKKKIFLLISTLLVLGLAIVAYSYGTSGLSSSTTAACCCCSGESCPMKTKDASGKETMSCCDADCCKGDGESCPMMKKDAEGKPIKTEGAACCPMMKKDGSHAEMKDGATCPMMKKPDASASTTLDMRHDMKGMTHADMKAMHGEGCCCPCCNKEKKEEKPKDAAGA